MRKGSDAVSRIIKVIPNDDYTLLIEFEHGNKIQFDMKELIKTIPYRSLRNIENFRNIRLEEKAICWQQDDKKPGMLPVRLTVDNILFTIRD